MRHPRRAVLALTATAALVVGPAASFAAPPGAGTPSAPPPARLQTWLADQLAGSSPTAVHRVFVHADTAQHARDAATSAGLRVVETWNKVGIAVAEGPAAAVQAVRTKPYVQFVEGDKPVQPLLVTSNTATRGKEAVETLTGADGQPLDGRGVGIAIIDSGVDGTHPFFRRPDGTSKVVRNLKSACVAGTVTTNDACFVDVPGNDSDTTSAGGHGTHVAGIAAGVPTTLSDGRTLQGAAPGASLVALSVGASLSIYGGDSGLNWVLENHDAPCGAGVSPAVCPPIRVTNNSYGTPGGSAFDPEEATVKLQRALLQEGVVTVWAAGNDGGDGTGSSQVTNGPGNDPTPGILMVASYNDQGTGTRDGSLSSFSSRGVKGQPDTYPDISAPGDMILSACRPYLAVCNSSGTVPANGPGATDIGTFNTISGTSMATPHIVGIVAQLLQAKPTATPAEIENAIEDGAHKFTAGAPYEPDPLNPDSTTSFDKGHGLVDVVAAYGILTGTTVAPPPSSSCGDGATYADKSGDATGALGNEGVTPNDPALDVVQGRLSTDAATGAVTFTAKVADLTPPVAYGQYFDYNVTIGGASYFLSAQRTTTGTQTFALGDFSGAGGTRATKRALTGAFDDAADEVRVVLPADAVTPALASGDTLGGLSIVSRRQVNAVAVSAIPDADTATSPCPYTVGGTSAATASPTAGKSVKGLAKGRTK